MTEYIDRDAVINEFGELFTLCYETLPNENGKKFVVEEELQIAFDHLSQLPAADVRPAKWKSVREHTPEPGRYLTCRKSMTFPPSYYCSILSYTDNLESIDEYDFEGERIPGWFEYDSEYGYYSCDNVEWFMPLPPMPPNCGADMKPEPPKEE